MDIREALYTTRMMRRSRPDPVPLETQARILDAAVRAPNGGNTQRWHFVAVDDPELIGQFAQLFRQARDIEYQKFNTGAGPMAPS
jgi:nitroreductase